MAKKEKNNPTLNGQNACGKGESFAEVTRKNNDDTKGRRRKSTNAETEAELINKTGEQWGDFTQRSV